MQFIIVQVVSNAVITIVAILGLAIRLEHRLTRIETDVSWLKEKWNAEQSN